MTEIQERFVELLSSTICGRELPPGFAINDPNGLYRLAKEQDAAHLISAAIEKNGLLQTEPELRKAFQKQYYAAVWRVAVLETEIAKIRGAFESSGIDFVLLKGSIVRKLYPEPWMRVSADVDVLVRAEELERAEKVLVDALAYQVTEEGPHHDHVAGPNGFHVDLHFTLTERKGKAKELLDTVWDHTSLAAGCLHEYRMDDDMFYLFHMFHAASHFQGGGCGVKPVLDTWLLNRRVEFDRNKRIDLLERAGMLQFAEAFEAIADKWFSGRPDGNYSEVEDYLLNGGIYGGEQRKAAVLAKRKSSGVILNRIFPPYYTMLKGYPILSRRGYLLPACWIHRMFTSIWNGKIKRACRDVDRLRDEKDRAEDIAELFQDLGI